MTNTFSQQYKVNKNNVEEAYEYQLGLKNNEDYEKRVDSTFLELANLFKEMYPNVNIEPPRGREKSNKSLKTKIENLEIERLCKLYAIEGISEEEKDALYKAILKVTKKQKKDIIEKIFFKDITYLKDIDEIVKEEEIPENIKTALLRIIKIRLQRENIGNKDELQIELDKKYGETASKETKQLKNNLLKWESIEKIKEEDINKLHCPFEYLKVKDLRGIKIVIAYVPYDIKTNNEEIKQLLEKRKEVPENDKSKYNDLCCIELAREFAFTLMNNSQLLDKLNIQVLQDGYKHKEKQNGYIAEHIKFCYKDHPEYIFELQLRSMYREDLSRANGPAAHDKRSGKKRIFPNTINKANFIKDAQNMLPKYILLQREDNKFRLHKCTMEENMLEYYLGYVKIDEEQYEKVMQYIKEEETQK